MTTAITVSNFNATFVEQLNANFTAIDAAIDAVDAAAVGVPSLAELKNLTGAALTGIVSAEYRSTAGDGGGGMWAWRSGNQSSNVSADTQSGIWAAPSSDSTGASGAWQRIVSGAYNARWFGATGDGTTNDTTALQAAMTVAVAASAVLYIPPGTYSVSNLTLSSNANIQGAGIGNTTLKQRSSGAALLYNVSSSNKSNIYIRGLTLDANNYDSGINVTNVDGITVLEVEVKNNPYWGVAVGIDNARVTSTTIASKDVLIQNCRFPSQDSTYEGVLLYNAQNCVVSDCYFAGKTASVGIGVGLYQNLLGVTVENCQFESINKGVYYSVTTDQIVIDACRFISCTANGVLGANESDHGLFTRTDARGVTVTDCYFTACGVACEMGAVKGGYVGNCNFTANVDNALVIAGGNAGGGGTIAACRDLTVQGCVFRNNNSGASLYLLHPAVLFNEIGGSLRAFFIGCQWIDDQGTPTQKNAVSFDGAYTWSEIYFIGCSIPAYSGGSSVANSGSSTLTGVRLISCTDIGALASGVYADIDANGSVAMGSAALATNATDGFLYIRSCAGTPSGTPTSKTGLVPIVYDSTNNKIYVYNGAWKATAALT